MNNYKNNNHNVKDPSKSESKCMGMQDDEDFVDEKEMKGAIHIGVLKASDDICIKVGDRNGVEMNISEDVVSKVAAFVWDTVCNSWIDDLSIFAGHGNRQKIQLEDISLMTRRSPELFQSASLHSDQFSSLKSTLSKLEKVKRRKNNESPERSSSGYALNTSTSDKLTLLFPRKKTKTISPLFSSTLRNSGRAPKLFQDYKTPVRPLKSTISDGIQYDEKRKTIRPYTLSERGMENDMKKNYHESDSCLASGRKCSADNVDCGKLNATPEFTTNVTETHENSNEQFGFRASSSEQPRIAAQKIFSKANNANSVHSSFRTDREHNNSTQHNPTEQMSTKKNTKKLNFVGNSFDEFDFDI